LLPWITGIMGLVLLIGGIHECLPFWPSLYPRRVVLFFSIPLAFAVAEGVAWLRHRKPRILLLAGIMYSVLFVTEGIGRGRLGGTVVEVSGFSGSAFWRSLFDMTNAGFTHDDRRACEWIGTHTPPDAVIETDYSDGGAMVPVIAHRKATNPHYHILYKE